MMPRLCSTKTMEAHLPYYRTKHEFGSHLTMDKDFVTQTYLRVGFWDTDIYKVTPHGSKWIATIFKNDKSNPEIGWKRFHTYISKPEITKKFQLTNTEIEHWTNAPGDPCDMLLSILSEYLKREIVYCKENGECDSFRPIADDQTSKEIFMFVDNTGAFFAIDEKKAEPINFPLEKHNEDDSGDGMQRTKSHNPSDKNVKITTLNICSLNKHIHQILEWDTDVIMLQETGCIQRDKPALEQAARDNGWYILWGGMARENTLISKKGNKYQRAASGGLAVILRNQVKATNSDFDKNDKAHKFQEQSRIQRIMIQLTPEKNLYLYNMYGITGARTESICTKNNEFILQAVMEDFAAISPEHAILCGDLNTTTNKSQILTTLTETGFIVDTAKQFAEAQGNTPGNTYWKSNDPNGEPLDASRLDYVFARQDTVKDIEWLAEGTPAQRVSTHIPISFSIKTEKSTNSGLIPKMKQAVKPNDMMGKKRKRRQPYSGCYPIQV